MPHVCQSEAIVPVGPRSFAELSCFSVQYHFA